MNDPILTVVIPCFNQGHFIDDALQSLEGIDRNRIEIIIINDGSTDPKTNEVLSKLSASGYHVISQMNKGLGEARNAGIRKAAGKYILPLDADNRIKIQYIEAAIEILDKHADVAVVYGNAEYFGDKSGILRPGEFNLQRMMLGNYIDACAVIRKSVIEQVGFYDNMKIMGLEDWDLWLRIGFAGHKFEYVDKNLFYYRVTSDSMMKAVNSNIEKQNKIENYFVSKYKDKLDFDFVEEKIVYRMKKRPFNFLYRLILKKYFPEKYNRLIKENKIYQGYLYGRI